MIAPKRRTASAAVCLLLRQGLPDLDVLVRVLPRCARNEVAVASTDEDLAEVETLRILVEDQLSGLIDARSEPGREGHKDDLLRLVVAEEQHVPTLVLQQDVVPAGRELASGRTKGEGYVAGSEGLGSRSDTAADQPERQSHDQG